MFSCIMVSEIILNYTYFVVVYLIIYIVIIYKKNM